MSDLNKSIISIRVKLQNSNLKKSGKNKFAGFEYFELADFLPRLNELMLEEGINDIFSIENDFAKLQLIKGESFNEYRIPFVMFDTPTNVKKDSNTGETREIKQMQDIQYLGALNTYYKRYLYLNAFGITDGEAIDGMDDENNDEDKPQKEKPKVQVKATEQQIKLIEELYTPEEKVQILEMAKVKTFGDLTIEQASTLIANRRK